MEYLKSELREFILENFLFGQVSTYSDSDSFLKQGIIDSTGVLELISFIEQRFCITVDDEEIVPENLDCIDSVCRFIERKTGVALAEGTSAG